jgi:hypothetical protein
MFYLACSQHERETNKGKRFEVFILKRLLLLSQFLHSIVAIIR